MFTFQISFLVFINVDIFILYIVLHLIKVSDVIFKSDVLSSI
jgi:hypothetical protein